mmetsp:Transcript_9255/g.21951  ORF Transcript_9255/g.21951 Transcript_9255/m.21951 type:complete len:87 (-) Transcript_9255:422-682(-)
MLLSWLSSQSLSSSEIERFRAPKHHGIKEKQDVFFPNQSPRRRRFPSVDEWDIVTNWIRRDNSDNDEDVEDEARDDDEEEILEKAR